MFVMFLLLYIQVFFAYCFFFQIEDWMRRKSPILRLAASSLGYSGLVAF
jgi:hypothetical protein